MFDRVAGWCAAWAVGAATQEECDELGMAAAQKLAAQRAIEGLGVHRRRGRRRRQVGLRRPRVPHVDRLVKADACACRSPPRRSSPR